jgi:perosamine synthetase
MLDHGVATRRGIMCVHREKAYADLGPHTSLSRSEQAQDGCMLLPLFPRMAESMQATVITALAESLAGLAA